MEVAVLVAFGLVVMFGDVAGLGADLYVLAIRAETVPRG